MLCNIKLYTMPTFVNFKKDLAVETVNHRLRVHNVPF